MYISEMTCSIEGREKVILEPARDGTIMPCIDSGSTTLYLFAYTPSVDDLPVTSVYILPFSKAEVC